MSERISRDGAPGAPVGRLIAALLGAGLGAAALPLAAGLLARAWAAAAAVVSPTNLDALRFLCGRLAGP